MPEANNNVKLSLKAMVNKEKTKVLFAEADIHLVEILLSFLTLPLGRILKIFENHYGDKAPTIGSLSSLYHSLANLDAAHFVMEGARNALLNPTSSCEDKYEWLKLDISDSRPAEYFYCTKCNGYSFRSVSMYYDLVIFCRKCLACGTMRKIVSKSFTALFKDDKELTIPKASFIICDDLHILPNEKRLLGIIGFLGTTGIDEAEEIQVDLGFNEVMDLLKASLTSQTPLLDVILNKASQMRYSANILLPQPQIANEERQVSLKVMIQKSTGKLLYAQAKKDFIEFLFSFLHIPLGRVEHLVAGNTCIKAIDTLYRSAIDLEDEYYFNFQFKKELLIQPNLPHGCISKDHILPLIEESLPADYTDNLELFFPVKFPNGQGSYVQGPPTFEVKDDLTVTPFCIVSILSSLREQKISISDVKEVELQIGLKEGLSILKASLTSTSALSDALLKNISNKRLK